MWLWNVDKTELVNVDHVERIRIQSGIASHEVCAHLPSPINGIRNDNTVIVFSGNADGCKAFVVALSEALGAA